MEDDVLPIADSSVGVMDVDGDIPNASNSVAIGGNVVGAIANGNSSIANFNVHILSVVGVKEITIHIHNTADGNSGSAV